MGIYGKKITLFLVEGNAEGIVTAELSNWNARAIKIPRISVTCSTRSDLKKAGIYFLFGDDDKGNKGVYIGESENVLTRLMQHLADYKSNKEKFYWHTAVVFVSSSLNKTLIRYLENKLFDIVVEIDEYELWTKNTYKNSVISEADEAAMLEFIDNIKIIINTLGFNVLEKIGIFTITKNKRDNCDNKKIITLYCTGKRDEQIKAFGFVDAKGFLVCKGSKVSSEIKQSFKEGQPGYYNLRIKLQNEKIIDNFIFTKDYLFTSPSAAAAVILGRNANGKMEWKDSNGIELKNLDV